MIKNFSTFYLSLQVIIFFALYSTLDLYRTQILLIYIFVTMGIYFYILLNPSIGFNKNKTEISIIEGEIPLESISTDIDEFVKMYKFYKNEYLNLKVYFKREDKNEVVAIFEHNSEIKYICYISNLYELGVYRSIWWDYKN